MNRPIIEVWIPIKEIFQKDRITDEMIEVGQLRLRVKILTLPEGVEVTTEGVIHTGIGHPLCPVPITVLLRTDLKDGDDSFQELIREKTPTGFSKILLDPSR